MPQTKVNMRQGAKDFAIILFFFFVFINPIQKTQAFLDQSTLLLSTVDVNITDYDNDKYITLEDSEYSKFLKGINSDPQDFCLDIPVLLYHHIKPLSIAKKEGHDMLTVDNTIFEKQLQYLKDKKYSAISAQDLVNTLYERKNLEKKTIVLTLDDGYDDHYYYAYPLALKYEITINLMIPTGLVGKKGYLTWEQIREMRDSGLVYIYNHTYSHAQLTKLEDEQIEYEIMFAQYKLQEVLNAIPRILTYPYGSYDQKTIEVLKRNKFQAAFTTNHSHTQCLSQIYKLNRNHVANLPLEYYGL